MQKIVSINKIITLISYSKKSEERKNCPIKIKTSKENIYNDEYKNLSYFTDMKALNCLKDKPSYYGKKMTGDTNDFKTKWKNEKCHYWEMNGFCKYGDNCAFAHGEVELKNKKLNSNYKTKPCKQFFEIGFCPYGTRCQFSHKKESKIEKNNKNINNVSYVRVLYDVIKGEKVSEKLLKRPRLNTFENIAKCSNLFEMENYRKKLFDDINDLKNFNYSEEDNSTTFSGEEMRKRFLSY